MRKFRYLSLTGVAAASLPLLTVGAAAQTNDSLPPPPPPAVEEPAATMPSPDIDSDGDGTMDGWDRDGDGIADLWDLDGDNTPDAADNDGDGEPDEYRTGFEPGMAEDTDAVTEVDPSR